MRSRQRSLDDGPGLRRRRVGDLLQTRSLERAYGGQFSLAVQDANALLALAEQTGSPWLHPERLVEKLLAAPGLTAAGLSGLRFPRGEGFEARLQRLLVRSEHAWLELWERLYQSSDPLDFAFKGTHEVFWAQASIAAREKAYDDLWEAAYAPPAQRLGRLREAQAKARALRSAEFWAPQVADGPETLLRDQAERDCAEVGVAVANYRLLHGTWPDRLEQLVPESLAQVPKDPFDGAPLRYLSGAAGARVYNVGPDLKDDGGVARSNGARGVAQGDGAGEVVFTVPVPR